MASTLDLRGILIPNINPVAPLAVYDGTAADTTPTAFTFTDVTGVALSSVNTSNTITVLGINAAAAISITGGTYKIDSGSYVSSAGTVNVNQTVTVRVTASASNSTAANAVLTIGSGSDTYTATTAANGAFFTDDFASGDLTKQLSAANFWETSTNVSVISGFSRAGFSGNCVRFNFGIAAEAISELRYNLMAQYPELYFKFYLYYPNGSESPSVGPNASQSGSNNKFFRVWGTTSGDTGNGSSPRFGASYYADTPSGDSKIGAQGGVFTNPTDIGQIPVDAAEYAAILNNSLRGTWVKVKLRVKTSTATDASDAIYQCWINDVLKWNLTGLDVDDKGSGFTGFRKGYLMGAQDVTWDNSGTYVYMDDFAVSEGDNI